MNSFIPLVSIIIPSLNEASYIDRLLEALTMQTMDSIEIIVSDAQSQDGTAKVVKQYQSKFHLDLVRSSPQGPANGRNLGAAKARGEWLLFLDADVDIDDPEFVSKIYETTKAQGWQTASAQLRVRGIQAERFGTAANYKYMKLLAQTKHPVAPGFCILTRRDTFIRHKGFNEKIHYGEDYDYVSRAGAEAGFGFVDETYYYMDLRRMYAEGFRFVIKNILNELYRHTHKYNLERNPLKYEFGKHKARK